MAVGRGAKASKVVTGADVDSQELVKAVEELRQALGLLNLNATQQELVEEDVQELEEDDADFLGDILSFIEEYGEELGILVKDDKVEKD